MDDYNWNYTFPDFFNFTVSPDIQKPKIQPIQIVALTFYALVFLLGVPGNAIVVWVTGFKMAPSVTTIWFLNLALTDFLCCLSLPLLMVPLAHDDHWHFGSMACTLIKGLFFLVMYCSILQLVLISLDRWLLVARPVWCHNNRRLKFAVLSCVGVWCLALIGSIPQFIYAQEIKVGEQKHECVILLTSQSAWLITQFRFVFGFILPFLIIVICHWLVYRRADSKRADNRRRSMRMLKVIVAVVLSFFVCWLPLHIVDFLVLVTPRKSPHSPSVYLAHVLTLCLAYFNSCLNPLLYVCLGRGFKNTMNRSLCNILHLLGEDNVSKKSTGTRETKATSSSEKAMTNV
ncbi:C5a anaphylatoxin chemotactic receptor 1 [Corythoichthys intestinalis]|uniref:C5a anaphylatoxin chemotactic receptor 1 n=1 Tax=Corythoichthys intestinalis TaxID=161448 RepID=UPI0025A632C4|nr:C5a anaphylatoxin chemotactic receptor 1 [Corythoichthys intestinalis]XP_061797449.1 C5a anaphylatoxin chemotactic receptor 1-like [Nerophis lumbriciformis]